MFAALRTAVFGEGRHRPERRRTREVIAKPRTVEVVDASTLQVHLLSADAERRDSGGGTYIARCGTDVTPAVMVEPGHGYCQSCSSGAPVPAQETR